LTLKTCEKLNLDGLILVGASHTLQDALHLSEYLLLKGCKKKVVAIPASIDNTVYHSQLEVTVGFSSSSHMYSTLIANLMTDASSNTKYWYFIRLMGRDPSNLALECALSTHPNLVIISE
jgi:6-phosphofructokinase